eukprot:GILI01012038.1.p1 GENE.GILI01012038.1~~GILI01012038.1.p1  ORF type:complete len:1012 (+),score=222.12 GILI01012038.1:252-3287(+)
MIVDYGNLGTASPATAGANINAFLALCIPIIERFGGVVDLLQASQLLVSFNYHLPVVKHEDIAAKCALVIMAVIQRGKEEENDEASAIIATNGEEEEGVSTTPKNPALYLRTANIAIAIASGPNVVGTVGSDATQKARIVTGEGVDMAKKLVALQRVLGSMELSSANGPATTAASSHQKTSNTIVGSGQISVSSPAPQHQSAAAINADNYGGILMTEATMEKCSVLGVPVDVVAPRWLQPGRARNVAVYELVGFDLKKRDPPEWAKNIANGFQLLRRKKYADAIAALDKPAAEGFRQAVRLRAICHRNIEMRKTRQQLNGIGSASTRNTTNGNFSTASDSDAPGVDFTYERKETLWEGHNDEVTALKYNSQLLMRLQQQQQQQGSSSIVAANQQTSGSGGSVPNSPRRAAPASGLINVSNLLTFGSIGMGASGNPAIDASLPKLPSHGGSYNNSAQLLHNSGNSGGGGGNLLNTNFLGNPQLQTQPPRLGGAFNAPEDDIGAIRVQLLRQQAHSTTNGHSSSQHASAAAVATPKVEEEPEPQEADEDRLFSIFVLPNHHDDDDEPPRRDAATKANSGEDEKRSHGGVVGSAVRSFSNGSGQNETKNDANSKPTGQNGKAAAFENDEMPLLFTDMSGQNYTRSKSILGKGAFGLVTSAMDDDGTIVAVKTMSIGGNISSHNAGAKEEAFRARIEELVHEVGVLAEVRHANIAGYVSAAILPSHFCIIMEYLSGGSLRTLISSQHYGKIPAKPLCAYLKGILCGLQYLHEAHGYVHCDIKPDNIMLTSDGTCKLTDFGTAVLMKKEEQILKKFQDSGIEGSSGADSKNDRSGSDEEHVGLFASSMLRGSNPVLTVPKAVASSVTPATSAPAAAGPLVRGTPRYMAPEAALGDWTPASDVYSLGITLIELATGQHPWRHIKGGDTAFLMRLAMDKTMRPLLPPSLRSGGASYNKASGANPLLVDAGEAEDVISEDSAPAVPMDNLLLEFADMCLAHDPTQRASVAQLLLLLPNN